MAVGHTLAVVERLKQESKYGLSAHEQKKNLAVVERWPLWRGDRKWRLDCIHSNRPIQFLHF